MYFASHRSCVSFVSLALFVPLGVSACSAAEKAPGHIVVDRDHPAWLERENGKPFYLCGPGDPEGFLYRGELRPDGTRDGDQMDLIRKMTGTGANCIYLMAVRSHGGDGDRTHNPFRDHDPKKPLNPAVFDQWEKWFAAMDDAGIVIFFFIYDDDASPFGKELPADGRLDPAEAAFIEGLVSRFSHHRHLIWCVAEEYAEGLTRDHAMRIAERIREKDPKHPVAIHQNQGTRFDFNDTHTFDQFAVQWNKDTAAELHAGTVAAWNSVGGRVNVNMSECGDSTYKPKNFTGSGDILRHKIWAIALGGGYSMILGMDIASTPVADLETCGRLVRFMEATRFERTHPRDDLARADTDYVMAAPGEVYLAYADSGSRLGLLLEAGAYRVKFYNPATGKWVDEGVRTLPAGESVFTKPAGFGEDVAICLESTAKEPAARTHPDEQTK